MLNIYAVCKHMDHREKVRERNGMNGTNLGFGNAMKAHYMVLTKHEILHLVSENQFESP